MKKQFDLFYFSSTHWDREWYQDFQTFRYRLVKMVDKLIDLIENDPEYKTFHFDGQTIVLEDYLEIRPEMSDRLKKLITDGKILIGPWYVMPDEYLVSGESLIKNLQIGHKIAKDYGVEPWKYGYVCDVFGHTAQTPQIFRGFGIDYSILGRGTDENDPTFFRWQAPDGSEVYNFKLNPRDGYGNFKASVYAPLGEPSVDSEEVIRRLKAHIDEEIERSKIPVVILMDGLDHADAFIKTTEYINKIKELYPEARVHHVNLCREGEIVRSYHDKLPVISGEINKTAIDQHSYLHLITNTLSSYYTLKKENDDCQNLLEKTVEPLAFYSSIGGRPVNHSFIDTAYKHLIQNHPHDSICGCSIDQVHKDMEYRFAQVKEIGGAIVTDYLADSIRKAPDKKEASYESVLTLYNTLTHDVDKTVTVDIDLATDYPSFYSEPFGYEKIGAFKIFDYEGNEIPYQVVDIKRNYIKRLMLNIARYDVHTVTFRAKIPAAGSAEYKIVPTFRAVRYLKKLRHGADYMENEHLKVKILGNGSLEILDKKTNKTYTNLAYLSDDGEIGDGWYHANPINDLTVNSLASRVVISKKEAGPTRCVFKVTRYLDVPECLVRDNIGLRRSDRTVELKFEALIGLSEEARFVDVKLSYDNKARDHRLKLMLPTGITSDKYFSGLAFCYTERRVGIDFGTQDYSEHEQYEKATSGIFGKRASDGTGIAFVSGGGLHECCSYADDEGTVGVTLSRSFGTTVQTNGETRCQLNRILDYQFLITPLDSDVEYGDLVKMQDELVTPILSTFVDVCGKSELNSPTSILKVEGKNICTSIVKLPIDGEENTVVIRVFNPSSMAANGSIHFANEIKSASLTNLLEEAECEIKHTSNALDITLAPFKIHTYKVKLKT